MYKCIKFDFDCGSTLDPLGELIALPHNPYTVMGIRPKFKWKGTGKG